MPYLVMKECFSQLNPVLLVDTEAVKFYYGVPRKAEETTIIVAPADNPDVVEALRRLEPRTYTVYAPSGSVAARLSLALGYNVEEVMDKGSVNGATITRGGCGLYVSIGKTIIAPPCDVSMLYRELHRMLTNGVERVIVSAFGAGVDSYLHRLSLLTGARIMLVYCASGWLGEAGTVLDIETLEAGQVVEA